MRSMQWQLGILGTISAFAYRHRETEKNLCRGGRSQDLPNTDFQLAVRRLKQKKKLQQIHIRQQHIYIQRLFQFQRTAQQRKLKKKKMYYGHERVKIINSIYCALCHFSHDVRMKNRHMLSVTVWEQQRYGEIIKGSYGLQFVEGNESQTNALPVYVLLIHRRN